MLKISFDEDELWDERKQEFIPTPSFVLELEHSLISLSKWESFYEKPFLGSEEKSKNEILTYMKMMVLNEKVPDYIFECVKDRHLAEIGDYINSTQSATTFRELRKETNVGKKEVITSEIIYYWLVVFNIPFEVETWHLNRLFSLVRVCNAKMNKPKRMSSRDIGQRYREINEQRRKELGTRG